MQPLNTTILSRIYGHGRGWVFTPKHFADLTDPNVASAVLSQLQKKGTIRRVAHGLYDYPKIHPKLGALSPAIEAVIAAFTIREGISFQPAGAYAANLLGLSEQVPAHVFFLTNGKSRTITIGKITLEFKKTSEKKMRLAGTTSGLVVEAFAYLGAGQITEKQLIKIAKMLPSREKQQLKKQLRFTPIWMRPFLLRITGEKI